MKLDRIFSFLVPKDRKFFPLFNEVADNLVATSELLIKLLGETNPGKRIEYIKAIHDAEHLGDDLTRKLLHELNVTFITPFEREDIHELAERMDSVVDLIHGAAKRINIYNVSGFPPVVDFPLSPLVELGGIISIGDYVYFTDPLTINGPLNFAGAVQNVIVNYPRGINQLVIDASLPGTVPITNNVNYFLYIKNSVSESHGVLGHYCTFTIENGSSSKIELFAVESEVMKSFP